MSDEEEGTFRSMPMKGRGISIVLGKHIFFFGHARHNGKLGKFRLGIVTKEPVVGE